MHWKPLLLQIPSDSYLLSRTHGSKPFIPSVLHLQRPRISLLGPFSQQYSNWAVFQLSIAFTAICTGISKSSVWFSGLVAGGLCIAEKETEAQSSRALLRTESLLTTTPHSDGLSLRRVNLDQARGRATPTATVLTGLFTAFFPWGDSLPHYILLRVVIVLLLRC